MKTVFFLYFGFKTGDLSNMEKALFTQGRQQRRHQRTSGTTQLLSTDSQGQLRMVVLPTNTTTFCNRTGVDSSCYGPGAEAMGAHDTAIGVNSKADAIEGSTALGADSNATGSAE